MFTGLWIDQAPDYRCTLRHDLDESLFDPAHALIRVHYSTLNYKDALAVTGRGRIVRRFPLIPGIDWAGEIVHDPAGRFPAGTAVLLNGYGYGEQQHGGLAQNTAADSCLLLPLPDGLSLHDSMVLGTAGYTAMLAVQALADNGIRPEHGEIAVSGANGGVGSFAVAILAKLGYRVTALTRRTDERDYLCGLLGAADIEDAAAYTAPGKALHSERWAGAIDTLGSHMLANLCAATRYGGSIAACGLAQGMDFHTTVAPFILRGVRLLGIDSVMRPQADRIRAWQALAECFAGSDVLAHIGRDIGLVDVPQSADRLLDGQIRGRLVVTL